MGKIKKLNKKIALFLAVFFFSFNTISIYQVSADAGSIVVGGGSLGTNGLNDLAALFPYAAPIILGMFHQANMDIKLSQESQAAGMTKTQYLYDQIVNWKDGAPEAVSQVCERILTGTSIDSDGLIYLGQTALDLVKQIGNWIISNAGSNFIDIDVPETEYETVSLGSVSTYYGQEFMAEQNASYYYRYYSSVPCAVFLTHQNNNLNQIQVCYVSNDPNFTLSRTDIYSGYTWSVGPSYDLHNGLYLRYNGYSFAQFRQHHPEITALLLNTDVNSYFASLDGTFLPNSSAEAPDNYFEGSVDDWSDFVPGLSLPAGYTGAIDFGILNQILAELEESKNWEMTVEDYLQAINEAVNDQAIDVPIENVDDGSIAYVPDVVIVPDPVYDPVADPDIPVPEEVTPVIDDEAPPNFEDLMNQPLTLDLKRLFPFCIPFDLYNIFQKFNAPAVAPHFRINFTVPIVNQEVDYTIDFSPFNDVAAVLRTMELIAMVVLLAIATRRIFLRG